MQSLEMISVTYGSFRALQEEMARLRAENARLRAQITEQDARMAAEGFCG